MKWEEWRKFLSLYQSSTIEFEGQHGLFLTPNKDPKILPFCAHMNDICSQIFVITIPRILELFRSENFRIVIFLLISIGWKCVQMILSTPSLIIFCFLVFSWMLSSVVSVYFFLLYPINYNYFSTNNYLRHKYNFGTFSCWSLENPSSQQYFSGC